MYVMKPCKCGSGVRLQKAKKYWVECNCCWESSDKFWTIEEAVNDWNNHVEKMEQENKLMVEKEVRLIDANAIPWCNYDLDNYHYFVGVDKDVIEEMPTIDPESLRPHGKWIWSEPDKYGRRHLVCSNCCKESCYDECGYHRGNYCPNCGAKMED